MAPKGRELKWLHVREHDINKRVPYQAWVVEAIEQYPRGYCWYPWWVDTTSETKREAIEAFKRRVDPDYEKLRRKGEARCVRCAIVQR